MKHKLRKASLKSGVLYIALIALTALAAAVGFDSFGLAKPPVAAATLAELRAIDVGQGTGLLLTAYGSDARSAVLIDAGEKSSGDSVCAELDAMGIKRLDYAVITHLHTDHYGGMIEVLKNYKVDELWMPTMPEELVPTNSTFDKLLDVIDENGCNVVMQSIPRTVRLEGGVSLHLLDAFLDSPKSLNDTSLCLRVDAGNASFLITGDAEAALEDAMQGGGENIDADILVAGHHGSNTSSKQRFLNAVTPLASIVSVGRGNDYGLPSTKAIARLSNFGEVYRTDISGMITVSTDGAVITVSAGEINDKIDAGEAA